MQLVTASGQKIEKVMVAIPSGDQWAAGFGLDLALLMAYTTFARPDTEVSIYNLKGTYLPRARAALAQKAIDLCASHILWLDSDMRFPKDTLIRLLAHGRSIVAANYPTRQPPILPIATDADGALLFDRPAEPLLAVRTAPMGCMLTATQVFLDLKKPWFAVGYSPAVDDYAPEDTFFCQQARAHQYQVLVDSALSEQVRHVGTMEFSMDHARMTQAAAQSHEDVA